MHLFYLESKFILNNNYNNNKKFGGKKIELN